MNKKERELLDGMSVRELRDAMWEKEEQENAIKFGTKKDVELNMKETLELVADNGSGLFHVRVEDGCEGWECLVEIDRDASDSWTGDDEELVHDHILNFMIDNNYYPEGNGGGIEEIKVEEICRYSRPFFKIYK